MDMNLLKRANLVTCGPVHRFDLMRALVNGATDSDLVTKFGLHAVDALALTLVVQAQLRAWPDESQCALHMPWRNDGAFLEVDEQVKWEYVRMETRLWETAQVLPSTAAVPLAFQRDRMPLSVAERFMTVMRTAQPPNQWFARVVAAPNSQSTGVDWQVQSTLSFLAKQHSKMIEVDLLPTLDHADEPLVALMLKGGGKYANHAEVLLTLAVLAAHTHRAQCLVRSGAIGSRDEFGKVPVVRERNFAGGNMGQH